MDYNYHQAYYYYYYYYYYYCYYWLTCTVTDRRTDILAVSGGDDPVWSDDTAATFMTVVIELKTALPRPRVRLHHIAANDTI